MKRTVITVVLMVAVMAGSLSAQVIGMIDYIEGSVELTRNGRPVPRVDIGSPVENLDVLKTSADGIASISFDRTTGITGTVRVVPSSTAVLRLEQLSGRPSNQVEVMAGSVNMKVHRLAGSSAGIQVKTPSAVLGVRGTEFVVISFNGSALVACKEGEVFTSSTQNSRSGVSSVPGTMVQVFESGALDTGRFPDGDFYANWENIQSRWKNLKVDIFVEDPMPLLNLMSRQWSQRSPEVDAALRRLKANRTLQTWLADTSTGAAAPGGMSQWARERPQVMNDLITARPQLVLGMMTWFRINELVPYIPATAQNQRLANGQTVAAFLRDFQSAESRMMEAFNLFLAAEKQYMRRNDGVTPFTDF